ncbi:MAG TPA: hypothetical protein VH092_30475 [Urbifossiella sp.]|nr:hypothetical protein [Urbifossiella sp.]
MPAAPGTGVASQPPPPLQPLPQPGPDGKDKDKDKDKEKDKEGRSVKFEWPREINGRGLTDYIKETRDLDPAVRERALRTIPNFGPDIVRKEAGWPAAILARMATDKERDTGVRAAAYEAVGIVGLDKDGDIKEAVRTLFTAAESGATGGGVRLHAIQTLSKFGSKAEGAINYLIGPPMLDVAYESRRSVAFTLGRISMNVHSGPNHRSVEALFKLATDHSAPVRMEAYQSLVILGPPLLPRDPSAPPLKDAKDAKNPEDIPKTDEKQAAGYVAIIKKRLAHAPPPKTGETPSPTGLVERDKQVEIMARFVLVRLDPKELNDENLGALGRYVNDRETGPRLQALNVLGLLGPDGAKQIDDVVRAVASDDPLVVNAALSTLISFGPAGKPALPAVERLRERGTTKQEKEYWVSLADLAVKAMKEAEKPPEKEKKP